MTEKAFTMKSNEYCCNCGSFDLVRKKSSWIPRGISRPKFVMYCYGCDSQFLEQDFVRNAIRTLPLTVDDFFFQTNLRAEGLNKHQIRPLTQAFSICLIAGAVACLFIVEMPHEFQKEGEQNIEWASDESKESYEKRLVKSLQLEFEELVRTN